MYIDFSFIFADISAEFSHIWRIRELVNNSVFANFTIRTDHFY